MDDWMSIPVISTPPVTRTRMAAVLQNERPACAGLSLQRMTVESVHDFHQARGVRINDR